MLIWSPDRLQKNQGMTKFIAFLRGINVGGHRKLPMAELRLLLSSIGLMDVKTYIQSGNVVFKSNESDVVKLSRDIEKAIQTKFEFEVPVLVVTYHTLMEILQTNPMENDRIEHSYYIIPMETISQSQTEELMQIEVPNEHFSVTPHCIYFYAENGYGKAKCNAHFFERKLKITTTARNHKTMLKLVSLAAEN